MENKLTIIELYINSLKAVFKSPTEIRDQAVLKMIAVAFLMLFQQLLSITLGVISAVVGVFIVALTGVLGSAYILLAHPFTFLRRKTKVQA
jgi:hypothetical protein